MPDSRTTLTAEPRVRLDGGLNSRSSNFQVERNQVIAANNFRTQDEGSMELRDGASLLFTQNYPVQSSGDLDTNNRSQAPDLDLVVGGTFPQPQTYTCKVIFQGWEGNFGASLTSAGVVTTAGSRSIKVKIEPNNLGEGAGQAAPAIDDPFMQGISNTGPLVYIESTADPGVFYLQASVSFVWSAGDVAWSTTFTSFSTGLGTFPGDSVNPQPVRYLYHHKAADMAVVIVSDRGYQFATFSTATEGEYWLIPTDKDGNLFYLSRTYGPIGIAEANRVMVLMDGMRAKKSSIGTGGFSPYLTPEDNNTWTLLGATPPDAVPTLAEVVGAGAVFAAGEKYKYRQTFIYRHSRAVNRNVTEYWYSESRPVESAEITIGGGGADSITVTLNASESETNLYKVRLYRTIDGPGARYFRLADADPGDGTYSDTTLDATINVTGRKTDPDDEGKIPLDVPPNGLVHPIEHRGRIFGLVARVINVSSADSRVRAIVGTNVARMSLVQKVTYVDPDGSDTDTIEQSLDAWPDDDDHTVILGGSGHDVSGWISYRGRILVFKTDELGVITGTIPGNFDYETLYDDIGAIPNSIINVQGIIFFWNAEKGPYMYDGQSYDWVGFKIQPTWKTDLDNGFFCANVVHDRETNEVRWSFTDAEVDPDTAAGDEDEARGSWKEYAYHLPSSSWWPMDGDSTTRAREVRAVTNLLTNNLLNPTVGSNQTTFGDTGGRVMIDHGANADVTTAITASVEFRIFGYLEDFNWVKVFKQITLFYEMGTEGEGSVTVSAKVSSGANYATVFTLTGTTTGDQVDIDDIPSPVDATDGKTWDRGLWIKIDSTVDTTLVFKAIMLEYERVTAHQRSV